MIRIASCVAGFITLTLGTLLLPPPVRADKVWITGDDGKILVGSTEERAFRDQTSPESKNLKSVSMADLEDRLFRLPVDAVGDVWMIVITDDRVHFRVEAARPDPALYRDAEKQVGGEFDIPLVIDAVPPQTLFPKWLLLEPSRIGKPYYYCKVQSIEQAPPSLPDLWMGPGGGEGPPPGGGPGGPPGPGVVVGAPPPRLVAGPSRAGPAPGASSGPGPLNRSGTAFHKDPIRRRCRIWSSGPAPSARCPTSSTG